ncbi:hypothetical protein [Conexibacter woesei]|uniref:DUF2178 domain-containing protein n=1 Tax=Conexibacter woesei (strain DSM 14684 / CCUG 47730 / CIP 108061 / JCM 11494 / NBRC 100937 / ID131577) TaxID=469383 RepID=D3F8W1_CONWI|nr:hypothetical protein [Conexibacter woesei]ADB52956.1 conserved hypothetical protein [Conexibacter woesei DSM 14684]
MTTTVRNVLIILALGALVMLVPGGGNASDGILQALVIVMFAALAYLVVRLYRERRTDLYSLGERNRVILYGSLGLATITVVATDRMWDTGAGTLAWFALVGAAVYGAYYVFRAARTY